MLRSVQKELKVKIIDNKKVNRRKLENRTAYEMRGSDRWKSGQNP